MSIKQCQFAYDSAWYERKKALPKKYTWNKIMELGIEAAEKLESEPPEDEDLFEADVTNFEIDILDDKKWVQAQNGDNIIDKTIRVRNLEGTVLKLRDSKRFIVKRVLRGEDDSLSLVMKEATKDV